MQNISYNKIIFENVNCKMMAISPCFNMLNISGNKLVSRRMQHNTFLMHNILTVISEMYSFGGCQRSSGVHWADNCNIVDYHRHQKYSTIFLVSLSWHEHHGAFNHRTLDRFFNTLSGVTAQRPSKHPFRMKFTGNSPHGNAKSGSML